MEEGRERAKKNQPLKIDWEKLLPSKADGDDPPATLVIVDSKTLAAAAKNSPAMAGSEAAVEQMPDHELLERIRSSKKTILIAHTLPDNGEKLRNFLRRLEEESERRKLRRVETIQIEESDDSEKPAPSINSSSTGGFKDSRRENTTFQGPKDPSFASIFLKRMDENENRKCGESNAFDREVSLLAPCNQQKMRKNKKLSHKRRHGRRSPARHPPSKHHHNFPREGGNRAISNGNEKGASSIFSQDIRENFVHFYVKKEDTLPVSHSNDAKRRKGQTIVFVDEEEPQLIETVQQVEKPAEWMKEVKIYYPSRYDPESVEISYSDFDCLAPQAYLRSNIMNFYIRYLQQHVSPTNRVMRNCHFFNTFFYDKLKEVLSHKGNSRDEFFVKFRRWWKGVNNIFQKEYILIPINEDVHWSLVIICIPDKEDQSGPIILHLDSLGLHSSRSVFQNIKSFLIEEWRHLHQGVSCSDLPFADNIWEHLPRRIMDNTIAVPQQKNDYDCGLFVLYFMERFVEDAPGRLKKKDLAMFGKQWFKPEEASSLRVKINKLLLKEFESTRETDDTLEPLPPSLPPSLHDVVEV